MTIMLSKTYRALVNAGAESAKAQDAAEELGAFAMEIPTLHARLNLLTWMVGVNTAMTLAVLGKLLHG